MIEKTFFHSGDSAVIISFSEEISEAANNLVYQAIRTIRESDIKGIRDLVPSYKSLMVLYDPVYYTYTQLKELLDKLIDEEDNHVDGRAVVVEVPVLYGGSMGPDLDALAAYHQMAVEDVIALHSQHLYRVYMLGFQPGFPYLGGLPKALSTPRLASPRQKVPKGSVGIAGNQTGIYPSESPGGWRIIGRTPMALVDWSDEQLTLIQPGQFVKFVPIDAETYTQLLNGGNR